MNVELPPHNLEAEQELIGAIFLDPDVMADVVQLLPNGQAFYRPAHGLIYDAMRALAARGMEFTWITVANALKADGTLEQAGGMDYMRECTEFAPTSVGALHAASVVSDAFRRRQAIQIARTLAQRAYRASEAFSEALDEEMQRLYALASLDHAQEARHLPEIVDEWLAEQTEVALGQRRPAVSTGLRSLDAFAGGGLHAGRLHVLAARPGQGKTALATNIACSIGETAPVLMFSMEMAGRELAGRIISQRLGTHTPEDVLSERFCEAVRGVGDEIKLAIDDTSDQTIEAMRRKASMAHAKTPLGLVVVDYIQLTGGRGRLDMHDHLGNVSRGLKLMARELNVPVLALAQMNRDVESRQGGRPRMSDLKGSGAIEQDSDQIWFIGRNANGATLWIEKNRAGPTGEMALAFDGERTAFSDKP